jgi:hypothetical protein
MRVTMKHAIFMIVAIAATLASCTLDDPRTMDELGSSASEVASSGDFDSPVVAARDPGSPVVAARDPDSPVVAAGDRDVLATSDCLTEDGCEPAPEQTYAQCIVACNGGVAAIERFCFLIPHPVVKASCLAMRFGGPVVCANWCYWYFTPH